MLPIIYSDKFLEHDTGAYHPERPSRLTAITQALHAAPWSHQLDWQSPTPIEGQSDRLMQAVHRVHPPQYVEAVARLAQRGGGHIDPDTIVSEHSYDVALLAVSAWLDGVDMSLCFSRRLSPSCKRSSPIYSSLAQVMTPIEPIH
jgi:acetoin utilization deacetylase AcuC-like enzyme